MNTDQNKIQSSKTSKDFNLKTAIYTYTKQWKWFILSCIIFMTLAYVYIRYTTPQYAASAKIMLIDENEGAAGTSALNDLSIFSESDDAMVEDEIQVIKSRKTLQDVVKKLNLNLQYFKLGRIYETELYKNAPFQVSFVASDSIINRTSFNFFIEILSQTEFEYKVNEDDSPKKATFGENIPTPFGGIIITPESNIKSASGNTFRVKLISVERVADYIKNRISISPYGKSSKVIDIYLNDPIQEKAKEIINTLIEEYNLSTIEKKNTRSKNTADFIDERVELIASDLVNVDDSIVRFKTGNKITDVTSEAGQFLNSSMQNQQQLDASKTQLRVLNYMKESLDNSSDSYSSIPSNLGLGDASISSMSSKYNELLANRERLLQSAGKNNSVVVQLDQTLDGIRNNLAQSIDNASRSLNIQIGSLQNQSQRINSKIYSVPGQESELRSIERKQGIKESLYLYLLQKREEATISLTATSPSVKVIDTAFSTSEDPVSPNKRVVYLSGLFLGLLIPFGIFYVKDLLDTKIHNKEDLENEIKNITVLGEIPRVNIKKDDALIKRNDRSILAESFRIIRTNFDYIRRGRDIKDNDNVIFVTSTINGEGKSFFSQNLALTLANTDKRVLLIGADIRNPQINTAVKKDIKNQKSLPKIGLTEYLVDKSVIIGEAINTYEINGNKIDILLSGKVPPNPAELLMSDRMKPLFDTVSAQYDFVIVDTAPAMLVTDTLLFSQYAGHTIYLTRAGYTEKRILNFAQELHAENKLNGMMLVVNDVNQSNFGYGAKYGYYGAPEKKSIFKRR
ncbi:GumC family protein [Changchengzhania lutea]|uniref:GumC family protein n=1 Tax=Changchengzhania lutea TaxID=2049305 RepID=UPI00115D2057|nr:polysaccharide biosynthesis tyrosine autokinase [Changchengzhania lutea]